MAEDNRRTIRSPRFQTNRAIGFRSKPLSTTGNIIPETPTTPATPPVQSLRRVTTARPREEEESEGDFGRVGRRVSTGGGGATTQPAGSPLQRVSLAQPGQARQNPLGGGGFDALQTVAAFLPAPLNFIANTGLTVAQRAAEREEERAPGSQINVDRLVAQPPVNEDLIQRRERDETGDQNQFDREISRSRAADPFDQGNTGQGGTNSQDDSRGGGNDFGGFSSPEQGSRAGFFARGGLVRTPKAYAAGGLIDDDPRPGVEGAGDGNDDAIVATPADGEGPNVNFSDGEYAIPPDVVSALGAGDTESGAQILDQLVMQIRAQAVQKMLAMPPPVGAEERAAPSLAGVQAVG